MTKFVADASNVPGGQISNQILVAKLATNSSRDTEINFELFWLKDLLKFWNQCPGSVVPLAMFIFKVLKYGVEGEGGGFFLLKTSTFGRGDVPKSQIN